MRPTFHCYREVALGCHSVGRLYGAVLHDELAPWKLVIALLVVTSHRDVEPMRVAKLRSRPRFVPGQFGHMDQTICRTTDHHRRLHVWTKTRG